MSGTTKVPRVPGLTGSTGLTGVLRTGHGCREAGMTTAEYAVGTVAACGFGGVLYKVLTSAEIAQLLKDLLERALNVAF